MRLPVIDRPITQQLRGAAAQFVGKAQMAIDQSDGEIVVAQHRIIQI